MTHLDSVHRCSCSFNIEHLETLKINHTVPPLTVITSEHYIAANRPVRQYLWGTCDAADRAHSDFIVLKRLLLGDKVSCITMLRRCCWFG
jgi:septin family protein